MSAINYSLTKDGITIYTNGFIGFDCPIERLKKEPERVFQLLEFMDNIIQEKEKEIKRLQTVEQAYEALKKAL